MGVFDFLSRKGNPNSKTKPKTKADRELARMARLVENKMTQNFDRQEAIEQLGRMGTAASAGVLLKRFSWRMDPSITDQEEKEAAAAGIVNAGEAALVPLRDYCRSADSLTWPLRVLKDIVPEDRMADELLGILDQFDTDYVRNPEPKIQLIERLEAHPGEDVRVAVEPFLMDASEPVRFAAARTVFALGDTESVHALLDAFVDEESLRVRNRISQGFLDSKWAIPEDRQAAVQEALPEEFSLAAGHIVRR